ncbi:LSU ribosomal protein L6P [Ignisphaera aggregans DSM 17230]|uniref:Large ribosomal subunit protein uL6 n=1 Tax=Ignisphaera aggregans (strain DSM 17230 / JCM 13409 / AQ1.S1) TaxID=583356 RepID=E0SPZ3_IGNAA|nr:LSU ribosomal protein L6P [Ignisphaera aggregans DSM 17230]
MYINVYGDIDMTRKAAHLREEIDIPEGVSVEVDNLLVKVSGPKGSLQRSFDYANGIIIKVEDRKVILETFFADREKKALLYTIASHIKNMITGVTKGWRYKLKIVTSHFPVNAKVVGNEILIENFLGERAPRRAKIVGDVKVRIEGKDIIVEGIDLEAVAQTAANIEMATRVKDKDRRVFVDGVYIYEKGVAI